MRTLFTVLVVAAATALMSLPAMAGDQEVAELIAGNLKRAGETGQLQSYHIKVEFQSGVARLIGQVTDQQQLRTALSIVDQTPGVTTVENQLALVPVQPRQEAVPVSHQQVQRQVQPIISTPTPARTIATTKPRIIDDRPVSSYQQSQPAPAYQNNQAAPAYHNNRPVPIGYTMPVQYQQAMQAQAGQQAPVPAYVPSQRGGISPVRYDQPNMPRYAWPSTAAYPNYAGLQTPRQYSAAAWPYIGPFYPYPQVPLGWRKVTMKWHDGWWMLDFKNR